LDLSLVVAKSRPACHWASENVAISWHARNQIFQGSGCEITAAVPSIQILVLPAWLTRLTNATVAILFDCAQMPHLLVKLIIRHRENEIMVATHLGFDLVAFDAKNPHQLQVVHLRFGDS